MRCTTSALRAAYRLGSDEIGEWSRHWPRNIGAPGLIDAFLLSAACSLGLVRFSLYVAGYPTLGGDGLHVAHMLWGGLLMVVAIVVQIAFLSNRARSLSAVLGGLGLGLFVDEIGKFLTSDNNYFFKPAPVLIYTVLVAIYLAGRAIAQHARFTSNEYLVNAVEVLKEVALGDADETERARGTALVRRAFEDEPMRAPLLALFAEHDARVAVSRIARLRRFIEQLYRDLESRAWFTRLVVAGNTALAALSFGVVAAVILLTHHPWDAGHSSYDLLGLPLIGGLALMAAGLATALALAGASIAWRAKELSYRLFELSLLVTLLITQPLAFYQAQFAAAAVSAMAVPQLAVIRHLLRSTGAPGGDEVRLRASKQPG